LKPGQPFREDDEYERKGTANLFGVLEPLSGERRLATRLEFHFTPRHGRWLNAALIEFAVLPRSCLYRRIDRLVRLRSGAEAWSRYGRGSAFMPTMPAERCRLPDAPITPFLTAS
jgi:hypothetical protein